MRLRKLKRAFKRKLRRVARKIVRRKRRRRKLRALRSASRFYATAKKVHPRNKVPRGGYSI